MKKIKRKKNESIFAFHQRVIDTQNKLMPKAIRDILNWRPK
jgi:hypothetical protein